MPENNFKDVIFTYYNCNKYYNSLNISNLFT